MPAVYTFSRSDNEILQELMRVFSGRGTAREQWSNQAELLVEPVGWDALWKLSKDFCKRFSVRFPCIAFISVTAVDFESLSACVDVLSVQHESVTLPESVMDVPLIELWPTMEQREQCVNAATTAEFIDLLRFYYNDIWMPWDDQDDKILLPNTIEERMTLWSEMHNGTIPSCVARSIVLLRNSAINAHEKLRDLDSSLCEGELTSDDDSLLPPNYISVCAEMNAKLDGLMSKWTLYENPIIREQYMIKARNKYQKNKGKKNVVALWHGGSIFEFDEISKFLKSRVSNEQTLTLMTSSEDALALEPEEVIVCSKNYEVPEMPLLQISLCSYNGATLKASDMRSCLLMLSEQCRLRELTLHCALVNTVVLMRSGTLHAVNCVLLDDSQSSQSDFAQGIVAMAGAKILLEDCTFDNFYSGIVVHKGATVELRNCMIKRCGVGIQMYSGSTVELNNTTIRDCTEQSVRCEVDGFVNGISDPSQPNRLALNVSSIEWLSGFFNAINMPMFYETKIQTSGPATADHVIDIINKYRPVATVFAPPLATGIIKNPKPCDLTCFDIIVFSGGKFFTHMFADYRKRVRKDTILMDVYGQTENLGPVFTPNPLGPSGNCGRPAPDGQVKIDASTGEEETNASVLRRSVRLAQSLRKQGLVPGDVLALGGRNHLDLHIPYYAAILNGYPIGGVDPLFKLDEVRKYFKLTAPKVAFCEPEFYCTYVQAAKDLGLTTKVVSFGTGANSLQELIDSCDEDTPIEEFEPAQIDQDKVYAWLISTGGTTGVMKMAAFKHNTWKEKMKSMVMNFKSPSALDPSQPNRPVLNLSPIQWVSGFFNALSLPLFNQTKIQTSAPATVDHVIDIINKYRPISTIFGPPLATGILKSPKPCDLTCFNIIVFTGGKVYADMLVGFRKRVRKDTILMEAYGQTENLGPVFTPNPLGPSGNCGRPGADCQVKLVDPETGKEITESNVPGELLTKCICFSEYYNDPVETAKAFTEDGWYRTGDLLYRDEDNNYFFVDRLKMLIKYRSHQIVPPELEEVILRHPGVFDVSVTSIPHKEDGEHPVACVVRRQGSSVSAQEIKDLVAEKLSEMKHLRGGVVFLDSLPMTSTGKVARAQLQQLALNSRRE